MSFKIKSIYQPKGDQPKAIEKLTKAIRNKDKYQILLGVTGSGKTFTIANVIKNINKPTLILSHNKTLAAQLYGELKQLFPENAVEYFISYYDYYQPEAYIPGRDIYIEKDVNINEKIEMLRLHCTMNLLERKDTIVVASVSCIYGIGLPEEYSQAIVHLKKNEIINRDLLIKKLIDSHYKRNDFSFQRGAFRVKGDTLEIFPAYLEHSIKIEFDFDKISKIVRINPLNNNVLEELDFYPIYPANHFITSQSKVNSIIASIENELSERVAYFKEKNKLFEANRIYQRSKFDLEMIKEVGYCSGIENYSYHLYGGKKGNPPYCLIDYFPKDYLMIIDESHVTIPQIRAMYGGDYSRKKNLVDYGFRLPCAFDNRPLKFEEFENKINQVIFVSATPAEFELSKTQGEFVEQVIRPTGLIDPEIVIRPIENQVDNLISEINLITPRKEKVLISTLTKKMSEDLTEFLTKAGIKAKYLHSEISTLERSQIIRDLRMGNFDVLVGINLLREGLDLPEVSLVAILDADKAGFLRSETSLIQLAGRAARNINGKVIFYANALTKAIKYAVNETNRRRKKQLAYNKENNITPQSIIKSKQEILKSTEIAENFSAKNNKEKEIEVSKYLDINSKEKVILLLEEEMKIAAKNLAFEKAAYLRDKILELKENLY